MIYQCQPRSNRNCVTRNLTVVSFPGKIETHKTATELTTLPTSSTDLDIRMKSAVDSRRWRKSTWLTPIPITTRFGASARRIPSLVRKPYSSVISPYAFSVETFSWSDMDLRLKCKASAIEENRSAASITASGVASASSLEISTVIWCVRNVHDP